jgi:hypothetical protein
MEPLLMTSTFAGKIITNIGIGAICVSISTITSTAKGIYDIFGGISRSRAPGQINVTELVNKLDLITTVKIVESILKELPKDKITSRSLLFSLDSLSNITKKIEYEFYEINEILKYNDSLWIFTSYRSNSCHTNMNKLEDYNKILRYRFKSLIYLLKIKHELVPETILPHENIQVHENDDENNDALVLV